MVKNAILEKLLQWKITKIIATRCQLLRLKRSKFDFGWGSTLVRLGSLQRSPRPLKSYFLRGKEGGETKWAKGKKVNKVKQMIYIAVLCNSRIAAEPLYNTPLVHWTICRGQQYGAFSMKALASYQIILLGEQRHIRCEQLAQSCCPNNATAGVEPATSYCLSLELSILHFSNKKPNWWLLLYSMHLERFST